MMKQIRVRIDADVYDYLTTYSKVEKVSLNNIINAGILQFVEQIKSNSDKQKEIVKKAKYQNKLDMYREIAKTKARDMYELTNALDSIKSMVVTGVESHLICEHAVFLHDSLVKLGTEFKKKNKEHLKMLQTYTDMDNIKGWQENLQEVKRLGLMQHVNEIITYDPVRRKENMFLIRQLCGQVKRVKGIENV